MNSREREALARHVLALSSADQTEVMVWSERNELTRFTHNAVHQNVAGADVAVKVRAIAGKRTGVASTNLLDDANLRAVAKRAVEMAKLSPEDPDLPPLPAGGPTQTPPGAYVRETAGASPELRASMCDDMFKAAEERDYWCAGFVNTTESGVTIVNSSGARASFDGTDAAVNVKMNAADSTGYAEGFDNDVTRLDAHAIGNTSAHKARESAHPRSVDPGDWTVILEPAAFGELFTYLNAHFSAQAFDEGSSFLSDGLDKKYLGDNVTIVDDYEHPLAPGMPFDYEGQPTQRLTLIENGEIAGGVRNLRFNQSIIEALGNCEFGNALHRTGSYSYSVVVPAAKIEGFRFSSGTDF